MFGIVDSYARNVNSGKKYTHHLLHIKYYFRGSYSTSYIIELPGSSVTLGCTVTSNPGHFQVFWRKTVNGQESDINVVNSGGKYSGSTVANPSLTINNAASSDEATYICYATNSVGTGQSTSTSLDVVGSKYSRVPYS